MKNKYDFYSHMIEAMRNTLGAVNITKEQEEQIKIKISNEYGGQEVYLRKIDREIRRAAILKEFNGQNRKALCVKYCICNAQFYNLMKGGNGES